MWRAQRQLKVLFLRHLVLEQFTRFYNPLPVPRDQTYSPRRSPETRPITRGEAEGNRSGLGEPEADYNA
jgi:hypothetical protein